MATLLFESDDWSCETLQRISDACEEIACNELGLDVYPRRLEIITSEQMLDAYASTGMPIFYKHWSFGKHFAFHEASYRKGMMGLAYEIVINSSPCIAYLMEQNTATMQALVIAHAAFGHNHFFKNNYLFKERTDAESILPYLEYAKKYVATCEEKYGPAIVERSLDAAHALMSHGVDRSSRERLIDLKYEEKREVERALYAERTYNDLWRTVPTGAQASTKEKVVRRRGELLGLPQGNILRFLEEKAPRLAPWQRELLRVVRNTAEYFDPQAQTKLMNEGCATFVHYRIMQRLHEKGLIDDGHFQEFLMSHTAVTFQPQFDDPRYTGFNPYALGFAMMSDIARIATDPSEEDRTWFPDIAGTGDAMAVLRDAWANYRDESFIHQFLSPALIRKMRLFYLRNDPEQPKGAEVMKIHNESGYRTIRQVLAHGYDVGSARSNIEIVDVDLAGDRRLILQHVARKGNQLTEASTVSVLQLLADLWSYPVVLRECDPHGEVLKEYPAVPREPLLASHDRGF